MSIVLIGYRGSGKTTIGRRLADRLRWPFVDTDEMVVRRAGRSIRQIFEAGGESAFRELESSAVLEAAGLADHVIALGGGALIRPANRAVLKAAGHKLIYLRCDPKILLRRIEADPLTSAARPNLTAAGGLHEVEHLLAIREPDYRAAMDFELDTGPLAPDEAVVQIIGML